jgi:Icc-related predicted phosphoesterase
MSAGERTFAGTPRVRVAAVGDLHCTQSSQSTIHALVTSITDAADLLLLAGDLTDHGRPEEAQVLARELSLLRIPVVAVLGNHDFESEQQDRVREILSGVGVHVLDGEACEVAGIGIAGVKGFAGGFGQRALGPWGEPVIKAFVHEAVNEALKLETALARLRTRHIVALLHYAPIQETVQGEPLEIYPFVGCSRLEEPLSRYPVSMVFHGHAHRGQLQGATTGNTPVYNVSLPLLARAFPERPPFRVVELPAEPVGILAS